MGIHDRDYYRGESSGFRLGASHSGVVILIAANVGLFVVSLLLASGDDDWLKRAMEVSGRTLSTPQRWWQLLSYGFAHADVWHLFLNMFTLWMFGREVEAYYGRRRFLTFYLTAIFLGGLWWALRPWIFDGSLDRRALGASGACSAVLLLFILQHPNRTILFFVPMPAWMLGVILVALDLFGNRHHVAVDIHLTGFAFAAGYHYLGSRVRFGGGLGRGGLGGGEWIRKLTGLWKRSPHLRVHTPDEDAYDGELEREGDRVLEKLKASGDASLSAKERKILEAYSRQTREKLRRRGARE